MATPTPATGARATARATWYRDALLLALGALVLRLPALLADRHLTFDDGVYGVSALDMRAGELPFRDVFSPQGPLHLPLLYVADLVGLRTLDGPRLYAIAAGLVATVAAYALGRRLSSRRGAVLSGALVATSGSVLFVTGPISGDGPALALALVAVALAVAYRDAPTPWRAAGSGLAMGAALGVKLLVAPAAIPVGLLLLSRRRWRDFALAVGAAVALLVVAALPWGVDRVWDQSVAYHRESQRVDSYGGNARTLVTTLLNRDTVVVVTAVLAAAFALAGRRRRPAASSSPGGWLERLEAPGALLGLWAAGEALLLVWEPAMWRPHVSQLVPPLALLAGLRPPPWRALAVALVFAVPWQVAHTAEILWPDRYERAEAAVVEDLRSLPAGARVLSDEPGLVWRAGRRIPGYFVDASIKRVQQGRITAARLARTASEPDVCAVVVWSRRYGGFDDLPARLARAGYHEAARFGGPRVLYVKDGCRA